MQALLQARVAEVEPGAGVAAGCTGRQLGLPIAAPGVLYALHVHAPAPGMPSRVHGAPNSCCVTQEPLSQPQPHAATAAVCGAGPRSHFGLLCAAPSHVTTGAMPTAPCLTKPCQGF